MPITPAYTWNESVSHVTVRVKTPMPTNSKTSPNIVVTDCFLRVNYPPYLLLLDYFDIVQHKTHSVRVNDDEIIITVEKMDHVMWDELKAHGDKPSLKLRRDASFLRYEADIRAEDDEKQQAKKDLMKLSREKQWESERKTKAIVQEKKANERRQVELDLEAFATTTSGDKQQPTKETTTKIDVPIRRTARIKTKFTKVKGAARESTKKKEEAQKSKAKSVAKPTVMNNDDDGVEINEAHSVMLKDKADRFFVAKAYEPALNAYTKSLKADPNNLLCWTNRGICRLKMAKNDDGLYYRQYLKHAVDDISKALEILNSKNSGIMSANDVQQHQTQLLHRRGVSYSWLGDFNHAYNDFKHVRDIDEAYDTSDCDRAKELLDRMTNGDDKTLIEKALKLSNDEESIRLLTESLTINPSSVKAFVERATRLMKVQRYRLCLHDCNHALGLMREIGTYANRNDVDNIYILRGTVLCWLNDIKGAIDDFERVHDKTTNNMVNERIKTLEQHLISQEHITQANIQYEAGKYRDASHTYTKALHMNPNDPIILSNRASCHLKLDDVAACVNDCDNALKHFEHMKHTYSETRLYWWKCITLTRRGTARCWMNHLVEGHADYTNAIALLVTLQEMHQNTEIMERLLDFHIDLEEDVAMIETLLDNKS